MTLRQLLHRFRPAGAPGAAGPAAVPADRTAEAEEELRPVFAVLAAVHAEAADIRAKAAAQAAQQRHHAALEADQILAAAQRRAQDARAEAFTAARAEAARAAAAVLADARHEADVLRARALERLDKAVPSIVAAALDDVYGAGQDRDTP